MSTDPTQAALAGEQALLTRRVRSQRESLEALLSDAFHEFGISGREWDRADIIDALLLDPDVDDIEIVDARAEQVAPGLVLLRYVSQVMGVPRAQRTSLWREEDGVWRLLHHQGSPLPPSRR